MKYINLVEKLTEEDKKTLTAYINRFGCASNFIGVDKWLEQWSHSNQKLYCLLGNSFIKESSFNYEKSRNEKMKDMKTFVYSSDFKVEYTNFYFDYLKVNQEALTLTAEQLSFFNHLLDIQNFVDNKIYFGIKYKKPGANKMLQIQIGAKPLKAIYRVIEYFKNDYKWNLDYFETFKKKFGIVASDNIVKGKLCISIHPMDYITMSDNASNWQSCMSWSDKGCYHVGTIEMMNSNNVLCCYLTNEHTPFTFTDIETGEIIGTWNNKKWRKLFYFNKDIIMGGKDYPYQSKELTIAILDQIKALAKENLNYDYQFGPELYQDMVHVTYANRMENQKMWARSHSTKKHNIIWDTKGMYNDMLNDEDYPYWCYRNKVDHTKVISVSGKANCLCCNNSIIEDNENDNWDNEYNDRFKNTGSSICEYCTDNYFRCDICNDISYVKKFNILLDGRKICSDCLNTYRICPCCGKIFNPDHIYYTSNKIYNNKYLYNYAKSIQNNESKKANLQNIIDNNIIGTYYYWEKSESEIDEINFDSKEDHQRLELEKLACCNECQDALYKELKEHSYYIGEFKKSWYDSKREIYIIDPEYAEPYRMFNLKKASIEDFNTKEMVIAS